MNPYDPIWSMTIDGEKTRSSDRQLDEFLPGTKVGWHSSEMDG